MYEKFSIFKKFKLFSLIFIVSFILFIFYDNTLSFIFFVISGFVAAMLKCPNCGKYLGKNKWGYYSPSSFFDGKKCTKCNYNLD